MTEVVNNIAASQQLNLLAPRQQVFVVERQGLDAGFATADTAPTSVETPAEELPQYNRSSSDDQNPVNRHQDQVAAQPRPEPVSGPSKARIEIKHIDLGLTPSEVVGTPDILQRFDSNGDGRVDMIEAARAGVAREGVFTFAGLAAQGANTQLAEAPLEPITPSPISSVSDSVAASVVTGDAVDKKLFTPADVPGAAQSRKFFTQVAAQGVPTGTAEAPKKFYGQGAEVVVGKFAADVAPKFVEKAETKPTIVVTEDGTGETKIYDKVAQTEADQSQGKAGDDANARQPSEAPAKKLVLVEVAAYADASVIAQAAEATATAVTA